MSSSVSRLPGIMIKPSESCPSDTLNLSCIDTLPPFRHHLSLLFVYRHGEVAPEDFKEALSKVLVPYYPLAGRLKENSNGELEVACTGEGAWFIEAFANYGLDNYDTRLMNQVDDLVPMPPPAAAVPPLQFQLTRFSSQGFVIGFTFNHIFLDGFGAGQFLNAVAEVARGFPHPSIAPVTQREAFYAPAIEVPKLPPPSSAPTPSYQLEKVPLDISSDKIEKLKKEFLELTGEFCTSFDIAAANLWQNRTRAVGFDQDTKVSLVFPVNARGMMEPPLQEGYYGNCVYLCLVTVLSGFLVQASNAEVVKLIKRSKERCPSELRNLIKIDSLDASILPYATLVVTDFRRLGFSKVDYGSGGPDYVTPANRDLGILPGGALVHLPTPGKGIRLSTACVHALHLQSLVQYYENGTSS